MCGGEDGGLVTELGNEALLVVLVKVGHVAAHVLVGLHIDLVLVE